MINILSKVYYSFVNPDKVIFLDVDGTLNDSKSIFLRESLEALTDILRLTGAKIVVSSSYRLKGLSIQDNIFERFLYKSIKDILPFDEYSLIRNSVVDVTPDTYPIGSKSDDIAAWIKNRKFTGKFLVLDDIVTKFSSNQIILDKNVGLQKVHVPYAVLILGGLQ
jgi:hypothetical protein